jgi:hypothetical protein
MPGNNHIRDGIDAIVKEGVKAGVMILKEGTTEAAADKILDSALTTALSFVPESTTVRIGGKNVEIPLDTVMAIVQPVLFAGLGALVHALSPQTMEVTVGDGVEVVWDLNDR